MRIPSLWDFLQRKYVKSRQLHHWFFGMADGQKRPAKQPHSRCLLEGSWVVRSRVIIAVNQPITGYTVTLLPPRITAREPPSRVNVVMFVVRQGGGGG